MPRVERISGTAGAVLPPERIRAGFILASYKAQEVTETVRCGLEYRQDL